MIFFFATTLYASFHFILQMGNWFLGRISIQPQIIYTNTWEIWALNASQVHVQAKLKEGYKRPSSLLSRREKETNIYCTLKHTRKHTEKEMDPDPCNFLRVLQFFHVNFSLRLSKVTDKEYDMRTSMDFGISRLSFQACSVLYNLIWQPNFLSFSFLL